MPSARPRIALALVIASSGIALAGCTPSTADTVSAISTTTTSATPTAALTLSADQRARGEALLADAAGVLAASAGVVDEERRSVLDAALPALRMALDSGAVTTFDAAAAAVVSAREVVSGRVVELAQTALDESPLVDTSARDALTAAAVTLRDALAARAEASAATGAALAQIVVVHDSQTARAEAARLEAAEQDAAEAEAVEEAPASSDGGYDSGTSVDVPSGEPESPGYIDVPVKPLEMPPAPPMPDLPTLG